VHYDPLEKMLLNALANRKYEPDTIDVLLQAFRTIDTENKGFIEAEVLEELLTKKGSAPFRNKEVSSLYDFAHGRQR
jgi:Ca2+-binding EF-hand superfamily protein